MSNDSVEELWREAVEFVKTLRNIVIVTLASILILLVPTGLTKGVPLSFYLLKQSMESTVTEAVASWMRLGNSSSVTLIAGSPTGPVRVVLASALFFGILFSSPISLYLFYRYLRPALYPSERRTAVKIMLSIAGLFYGGLLYGFIVISPITIRIMLYFGAVLGVEPYINVADLYEFIVFSVLATVVGFLIPLAIYILNRVFHIDLHIRRHWRYIVVIGYAALAVLTPDPTPVTALLIMGPPLILCIAAELLASKVGKKY
ncbi:MAG: twin-arginine translocase subunit TatC [Ignisphaera sp.]|nr:twin-arginine translocase subunit TatC [Ignisphaera sp.]MDW8084765.1 twin-arginine translocase subunit TatC [Ignisphaera sp.]